MKTKFLIFLIIITCNVFSQTLREKIGQMLIVGFSGTTVDDSLKKDLSDRNLGGVILFGANIPNKNTLINLTKNLQNNAKTRLFVATDQEGGSVARLNAANGFSSSYSAFKIATTFNSRDTAIKQAKITANWFNECGLNINFAPVVDVNVNSNCPVIGGLERSFSSDPNVVAQYANYFIQEYTNNNIITSLKHFPGHGSSLNDSHLGFVDVTNTWKQYELNPYKILIDNGYDKMIMLGHLYNKNWDTLYPASLSYKVVTEMLKNNMNYKGLVATDELFMNAISKLYTFGNSIKLAINAGNDLLLFKTNLKNGTSVVRRAIDTIANMVKNGDIKESTIDSAYAKIIRYKQKLLTREIVSKYLPETFSIKAFPNPFNPQTTIKCAIPEYSFVALNVYNVLGQNICSLAQSYMHKGIYTFDFNASNLNSGMYFVNLKVNNRSITQKIVLMK